MAEDLPEDFLIEANELLDDAEDKLMALDKGAAFSDCYNSIFRAFHSLKGAAGMFGLEVLQKHMHFLEDLLEKTKSFEKISTVKIDYFLQGIDSSKKSLQGVEINFKYYDPDVESGSPNVVVEKPSAVEKESTPVTKVQMPVKNVNGYIYIVDDEKEIGDFVSFLLEDNNYKCVTFTNPVDLLNQLDSSDEKPDAIISDFKMPEMTGHQLMLKVHEKKPLMPFILISGFINKNVALESIANGVTSILEKPLDEKLLLSSVKNAVMRYKSVTLLNKSIDIILYQYADLENFLTQTNQLSVRDMLKGELKNILEQRKLIFKKDS